MHKNEIRLRNQTQNQEEGKIITEMGSKLTRLRRGISEININALLFCNTRF